MAIYCDHNATTPLRPEVLEAMMPFLCDAFGNPSSVHRFGSRARCAVEDARAEVDMNVVMAGGGELVEVQATAERTPFGRASLDALLELAAGGIEDIAGIQARVIASAVASRR